jgi:hypothetical protein
VVNLLSAKINLLQRIAPRSSHHLSVKSTPIVKNSQVGCSAFTRPDGTPAKNSLID